jgi:hypothetical protein
LGTGSADDEDQFLVGHSGRRGFKMDAVENFACVLGCGRQEIEATAIPYIVE